MSSIDVDISSNCIPAGPGIAEKQAMLDDAGFPEVYVYDHDGKTRITFGVEEVDLWPALERLRELGVDEVVLAPWEEERLLAEYRVDGFFHPAAVSVLVAASRLTMQVDCRLRLQRPREPQLKADATRAIRAIAALDFGPALEVLARALEPNPIEEAVLRLESIVAGLDLPFDPRDCDTRKALGLDTSRIIGLAVTPPTRLEDQQGTELVGAFLLGQIDDEQLASTLATLAEVQETRAVVCNVYSLIDSLIFHVEDDLEPRSGSTLTRLLAGLDWQDQAMLDAEAQLASALSTNRIAAIESLLALRQMPRSLFFVPTPLPSRGAPSFAAAMQIAERHSGAGGKLVLWEDSYSVFDTYVSLYLEALEHIGILDRGMVEEIEGRYNGTWRATRYTHRQVDQASTSQS